MFWAYQIPSSSLFIYCVMMIYPNITNVVWFGTPKLLVHYPSEARFGRPTTASRALSPCSSMASLVRWTMATWTRCCVSALIEMCWEDGACLCMFDIHIYIYIHIMRNLQDYVVLWAVGMCQLTSAKAIAGQGLSMSPSWYIISSQLITWREYDLTIISP